SVFQPSLTYHWPGNVKKYSVQSGVIVDQNSVAAVDPTTGFFKNSAQSFWSASFDGSTVTAGGAASQIPDWNPANAGARKLYTYIGTNSRSEEHTSELQSPYDLVCRLLLEKKNAKHNTRISYRN